MTEREARDALFKVHQEYMFHTPEERLKLYEEYKQKRAAIRKELSKFIKARIEEEMKSEKNNNEINKIRKKI